MRPMKDVSLASPLLKMFLVGHFRSVIVVSSIGCGGHHKTLGSTASAAASFAIVAGCGVDSPDFSRWIVAVATPESFDNLRTESPFSTMSS